MQKYTHFMNEKPQKHLINWDDIKHGNCITRHPQFHRCTGESSRGSQEQFSSPHHSWGNKQIHISKYKHMKGDDILHNCTIEKEYCGNCSPTHNMCKHCQCGTNLYHYTNQLSTEFVHCYWFLYSFTQITIDTWLWLKLHCNLTDLIGLERKSFCDILFLNQALMHHSFCTWLFLPFGLLYCFYYVDSYFLLH
jgi:hypothetical protein